LAFTRKPWAEVDGPSWTDSCRGRECKKKKGFACQLR
jgi:hypothetical protein